jgi:hypothetical protein
VASTFEPEIFALTGRIEEHDRQDDPVTPDVPVPPGSAAIPVTTPDPEQRPREA